MYIDLGLLGRTMATLSMSLTLWGIVFELVMPGEVCWWSGVSSTTSTVAGLGGVVQRVLGDGRVMVDSRMEVALSSVVASSAAGTTKIVQIFILKITRRFDGGDGFYSMCMRYWLRVC
jgi:hypothetical protein